ncbi:hypothetical protein INT45_004960 [Circinella minor]|uniref:Uncharacterized protein n=1 Tax=Circinella minor TaxID=1195481 RepID=A0A8H7VR82_9FUNG|nr:hypothetical protein INT45_004960 [Circinella minor]
MLAERTAPVSGYFMNPEQHTDWMKDFGELARKVASEARKLSLVTDDDRHWNEAHKISNPREGILQNAPQDLQQDLQRIQRLSAPASKQPLGPLGQKALNILDKLNRAHGEQIRALKMRRGNLGVIYTTKKFRFL